MSLLNKGNKFVLKSCSKNNELENLLVHNENIQYSGRDDADLIGIQIAHMLRTFIEIIHGFTFDRDLLYTLKGIKRKVKLNSLV